MPTAQYGVSLTAGGVSFQKTINRTGDGTIGKEVSLPAAKAITAWVNDTSDVATLAAGHGFVTGDVVDIYWNGGANVSYGLAATVSGNDVTVTGGSGDVLPASSTPGMVMAKQTQINVAIDGDNLKILGVALEFTDPSISSPGHVLFEDAAGDDIASVDVPGNNGLVYDIQAGVTNPFTGDPITVARASHCNTSSEATLKICGVDDSTP